MRDIKALHPDLQKKYAQLIKLCSKKGIKIGVAECLRTKAEQDALYIKGRTSAKRIESARSFDKKYAGTYKAKANCNLLASAGSGVMASVKKGASVQCYGYYTAKNDKIYLFVQYGEKTGFMLNTKLDK